MIFFLKNETEKNNGQKTFQKKFDQRKLLLLCLLGNL